MKKLLVTISFNDKTYDYIATQNCEVGDIVTVDSFGFDEDKEVLKVKLVDEKDLENSQYKYKEILGLSKKSDKGLKNILPKEILNTIKEKREENDWHYIKKSYSNYKARIIAYDKNYYISDIVVVDEYEYKPLIDEKFYDTERI